MANGVYEHRIVCRGVPKLTDKEIKDLLQEKRKARPFRCGMDSVFI